MVIRDISLITMKTHTVKIFITVAQDTENAKTGSVAKSRMIGLNQRSDSQTAKTKVPIETPTRFKGRHFQAEMSVLCVRWHLRYSLSYRDLEEMLNEQG